MRGSKEKQRPQNEARRTPPRPAPRSTSTPLLSPPLHRCSLHLYTAALSTSPPLLSPPLHRCSLHLSTAGRTFKCGGTRIMVHKILASLGRDTDLPARWERQCLRGHRNTLSTDGSTSGETPPGGAYGPARAHSPLEGHLDQRRQVSLPHPTPPTLTSSPMPTETRGSSHWVTRMG